MDIYHAVTSDVKDIYNLIQIYAEKEIVLPRTYLSLYQHLQCLYVMKENNKILGVAGLHVLGQDLAEIRSLVVSPEHAGKGIGRKLVNRLVEDAPELGISRVMSFTYETEFFKKCGFEIVAKETLPEKVWVDCMNCPKFNCCDEVAMIKHIG
jgi:amino-acid N-acetyltransferase